MIRYSFGEIPGTARRRAKLAVGTSTGILTIGLLTIGALGPAQAQAPGSKDMLYATSTVAKGSCPGMDWHIVVHSDKTVNGMVGWDEAKHMVHLTGTMDDHGVIKMNAVDPGSNKADTVTGTADGSVLKARISGTGTPCDDQTMEVPRAQGSVAQQ